MNNQLIVTALQGGNMRATQQWGATPTARLNDDPPKTFDDFVKAWFDSDSMFRVREQSKKSYRKSLKAFRTWTVAQGIEQPRKQDVKDWCRAMDDKKLSVATKNLRLTALRVFYRWLAEEYGVANIVDGLKGWKDDKDREHQRGFLLTPEMRKLMDTVDLVQLGGKKRHSPARDALERKRNKAILATLMVCGLRTVEISRLRVADLKQGSISYLAVLGKGKDKREDVKISAKAVALIQDWLAAREAVEGISDSSPLFCSLGNNSFGEPLSSNSVSTLCKRYLEAAGLKTKEIVAHSLRHSMATNALLNGATLQEVQTQLRHSNISVTNTYLHEISKAKNRCTDIISDAIF